MPSGKVHTTMTTMLAIAAAPFSPAAALGAFAGVFLTPDLDVDEGNYGSHVLRVLLGAWAASLWLWYWRPYARFIPHRSVLSHFPGLGTLLRLLYLSPLLLPFIMLGHGHWRPEEVNQALLGLFLADMLHALADTIVTGVKRAWRV